ncbi:MAG: hypothetical protein ACM3XS_01665 [Bacteroidota bacterium]
MAKRLTVLVSDELHAQLVGLKGGDRTITLMDLVRAALRLLVWYCRQREEGFIVCAHKEEEGKEIIREIVIEGL